METAEEALKPMLYPKPLVNHDSEFRNWITQKPCCVCHGRGEYHEKDGTWRVHPSHMRTRGAGHGDYFNLLPMCWLHHQAFEQTTLYERTTWWMTAEALTREYINMRMPERWNELYALWGRR